MPTPCCGWEDNPEDGAPSAALQGAMRHEAVPAQKTPEGRMLQIPQGLPRRISSHHTTFQNLHQENNIFSKLTLVTNRPTTQLCR